MSTTRAANFPATAAPATMSLSRRLFKAQWHMQRGIAIALVPVLRFTGFRFSKAWRGNGVIDHVAANILAEGGEVMSLREVNF